MSLQYELNVNKLTTPNSYAARVRPRATIGTDALAAAIGGATTFSAPDVKAVLLALAVQVQSELLAGNWVQIDGLGIITTSLKARVPAITDPLPADATAEIGFRADAQLRAQVQTQAQYERIEASDQSPLLLTCAAQTGGGINALAPSDVVQIIGDRLKCKVSLLDEGVFFVDPTGPATRVTNYLYNADKQLQFATPPGLSAGINYRLEVRNRRKSSIALRTASWPSPVNAT